jgi:hypothetical protein
LGLKVPKARPIGDKEPHKKLLHVFKSGLESNLHSISVASDQQNFLSSDEKSVNLWNLTDRNTVFNLVDFNRTSRSI